MKDLESKAVDLLTKFEDLAAQYTPDVIDAALTVVRINGASEIITSLFLILSAWLCYKFINPLIKKIDDEVGAGIAHLFLWIFIFCFALIGFLTIAEIWNWVSIFNPKLALAHKLLGL